MDVDSVKQVVDDVLGWLPDLELYIDICVPVTDTPDVNEDMVDLDSDFNTRTANTKSASFYGPRDFHVSYSDYNSCTNDDPMWTLMELEATLQGLRAMQALVNNLEADPRFSDVALMSPAARSRDGDNHVFCVGFNVARQDPAPIPQAAVDEMMDQQ